MTTVVSPTHPVLPVKAIVFVLEHVLIPSPHEKNPPSSEDIRAWLSEMRDYATSHQMEYFVATGYTEDVAHQKLSAAGLPDFFPKKHVWSVTPAYLDSKDPVDRKRYEDRCQGNEECLDEFARQVYLSQYLESHSLRPSQVVVVGHDYWFDGFYTRRFSNVNMIFIEAALSTRGSPAEDKVGGVWYGARSLSSLRPFLEGKVHVPDYSRLDSWVSVVLTEALFGGNGIPTLKKVVIQRKKDDAGNDFSALVK